MLESRPEDALVKLLKTVEIVETASDIYNAAQMNPEISHTLTVRYL